MRFEKIGDGAVRIPRPPNVNGEALLAAARAWPGVVDAVLTEAWLAVIFADDAPAHVDASRVDALSTLPPTLTDAAAIEIRVRYDGIDLEDVARLAGLTVERVVELHVRAEYTVSFLGFSLDLHIAPAFRPSS